jgi:diguanylate cyclase (GGDEF)-like protein
MTRPTGRRKSKVFDRAMLLDAAFERLTSGVLIFDQKRKIAFCNERYFEICGLSRKHVAPGTSVSELVGQQPSLGLIGAFDPKTWVSGCASRQVLPERNVHNLPDGRTVASILVPIPGGGGMVTVDDITDREIISARLNAQYKLGAEQEEALRARNLQFAAAINNMSQGLCFFDAERRLIVCNDRYLEMYGLARDRVSRGTTLAEIVDLRYKAGSVPDMPPSEYSRWRDKIIQSRDVIDGEIELRDGRVFRIRHQPMADGGFVATHEDITEQRRSEHKIARMARHDALTDLANRLLLGERLKLALTNIPSGDLVAVHHLDLDQFKAVNDTLGHPAGDRLLKMVADRLRALVKDGDTIARMGGDEFVLVQVGVRDPSEACSLAQRIIHSLNESYDLDGHRAVIGTSVGIAIGPNHGRSPDELLRNADLALYQAKAGGRGIFRLFELEMDEQMRNRRALENDIRAALSLGEFELYYQPVVNVQRNEIIGFEALLRWHHPERGSVPPDVFIPLAEELGCIVPIGEWVIRQACIAAAQWPEALGVAVNISAVQFRSPSLVQTLLSALAASGLAPNRLEIEITETVLLQDKPATLALLHQLRSIGIRIAMDDFGTGYSSLAYLQSFPFDKIKIDRSFVSDVTENPGALNIVRAISALARGIGMTATAEGVETQEQLDLVISEGCTEMQGVLFSRPLPLNEINRLFASQNLTGRNGQIIAA